MLSLHFGLAIFFLVVAAAGMVTIFLKAVFREQTKTVPSNTVMLSIMTVGSLLVGLGFLYHWGR